MLPTTFLLQWLLLASRVRQEAGCADSQRTADAGEKHPEQEKDPFFLDALSFVLCKAICLM